MKKLLIAMALCGMAGQANALSVGHYIDGTQPSGVEAYNEARDARDRANTATFVAVGALAVAIVATFIAIDASKENPGQFVITRF